MAPVCWSACRQLLPVRSLLYLFVFVLLFLRHYSDAFRTYDRQMLLHIRGSLKIQSSGCLSSFDRDHPAFIHPDAECVHQLPCCISRRKKRRRKRGRRGGIRVRIMSEAGLFPAQLWHCRPSCSGRRDLHLTRRSWDLRYACHLLISPFRSPMTVNPASPRLRVRGGGVNFNNIRPLEYARCSQTPEHLAAKLALLNARSVSSKTFILKDFFIQRHLDILFLTETWIGAGAGESSVFGELCPSNCSFISTPRSTGRGGGIAMIFKNNFKIRTLPVGTYSTFEIQCVKVESITTPLVCALVYRPPKPNKDFIKEFSDFLSDCITSYDRLLILGDFNIHVCCPDKPLVKDFCHVMDSFGLVQHINQPTHILGHTLDLILSHGFSVVNVHIEEASFSDHKPIVFNVNLPNPLSVAKTPGRFSRFINSLTASHFSECFLSNDVASLISTVNELPGSIDDLVSLFNTSCSNILDSIAPLKLRHPKPKSQPWLDDTTRSLRQACRRAERKWNKDKLTVSLDIFRNSLAAFQTAAKKARAKHFSDIINKHSHRPKILFSTINSIINPQVSPEVETSTGICETF